VVFVADESVDRQIADALRGPLQADPGGPDQVKTGEKLFKFLARLILDRFYGSVTIKFEHGKVTHVETETRRMWEYGSLPTTGSAARNA